MHIQGTVFDVGSSQLTLRGTVSIVSADNPASSLLGGFKQSGSAFRPCRHCMGTDTDIQTKVLINFVYGSLVFIWYILIVCRVILYIADSS